MPREQKHHLNRILVTVTLANSNDRALFAAGKLAKKKIRVKQIEAVVDTGAVMSLLPQDLVEALGLVVMDRTTVQLANDQRIELERAGPLTLTVVGRTMHTDCLIGPPGCEALLGQLVMEGLALICDPGRRTLTVRPESPYRPSFKLKKLDLMQR